MKKQNTFYCGKCKFKFQTIFSFLGFNMRIKKYYIFDLELSENRIL